MFTLIGLYTQDIHQKHPKTPKFSPGDPRGPGGQDSESSSESHSGHHDEEFTMLLKAAVEAPMGLSSPPWWYSYHRCYPLSIQLFVPFFTGKLTRVLGVHRLGYTIFVDQTRMIMCFCWGVRGTNQPNPIIWGR